MESRTHLVLYDEQCPLCTFQMRLLGWLDWFNTVSLVPISAPLAQVAAAQLRREDLLAAIHCLAKNGHIYRGARCLRFVGMRMPLLAPLSLVLWIPGVIWIAEKIYDRVSRNRYLLSRMFGCKEACAIMPSRKRPQDVEVRSP